MLLLVFGFLGISTRASSGATWKDEFDRVARKGQSAIDNSPKPDFKEVKADPSVVKDAIAAPGQIAELFQVATATDESRRNPQVLPVSDIQAEYLLAPSLSYDVYFENKQVMAAKDSSMPLKNLRAKRMVVVNAAFPYQDQLREYMQALHYNMRRAIVGQQGCAPHPGPGYRPHGSRPRRQGHEHARALHLRPRKEKDGSLSAARKVL